MSTLAELFRTKNSLVGVIIPSMFSSRASRLPARRMKGAGSLNHGDHAGSPEAAVSGGTSGELDDPLPTQADSTAAAPPTDRS